MPQGHRWRVRAAAGLGAVLLGLTLAGTDAGPAAAELDYSGIIQQAAGYVASAQLTAADCPGGGAAVGAIAENKLPAGTTNAFVNPYVSNYGALALVLAGGQTYLNDAFSYIQWYLGNVNYYSPNDTFQGVAGSMYYYRINASNCTETDTTGGFPCPGNAAPPCYDSSDAWAGTFLSLVNRFVQADPSQASYFTTASAKWQLGVIANAIVATLNPNQLSSALKSSMPNGEYTEDNIEASQGLADYSALLSSQGDSSGASYWAGVASNMRTAIGSSEWLASANAYKDAADQSTAGFTPCDAGTIQMWPAFDAQNTASWRSNVISSYANPTGGDPGWTDTRFDYPCNACMAQTVTYQGQQINCPADTDTASYTGFAAAQTGDYTDANAWLTDVTGNNWGGQGYPYPWVVGDSGFEALAAYVTWKQQPYIV